MILARRCSERPPVFRVLENTEQQLIQLEKTAPLVPNNICAKTLKREGAIKSFGAHDLPAELSGISIVEVFDESNMSQLRKSAELEVLTGSSDSSGREPRILRSESPTPPRPNSIRSPPRILSSTTLKGDGGEEKFADAVTEI